jgi:hypothetical protein
MVQMKSVFFASIVFCSLLFASQAPASEKTNAIDPTYIASGAVDEEGLTGGCTYTFSNAEKEADPGECLLMVNGSFLPSEVIIKNDRSLVPVRFIAESFGASVEWDGLEQEVKIDSNGILIKMKIGEVAAHVNNKLIEMDAAPEIYNSRTYVPLRFVTEAFGKTVGYLPASPADKTGYFNMKPDGIGIAVNPVIWVDEPIYENLSPEAAKEEEDWLKAKLSANLQDLTEPVAGAALSIEEGVAEIENRIEGLSYVKNIGRYALFLGPYVALVDEQGDTYFYTLSHMLCSLQKVSLDDYSIFFPMYFFD